MKMESRLISLSLMLIMVKRRMKVGWVSYFVGVFVLRFFLHALTNIS